MTDRTSSKESEWGQSMKYGLTELEAYDAMETFLEALWRRGGKSPIDLAVVLGFIARNRELNLPPIDIAQWDDWLVAVRTVVGERNGQVA
jgi:hypothetical protein